MESSAAHRKIELQSAEDFTYLINNVRRAAADSIDAAFPPVDGVDGRHDELRVQIERFVNDYITRTFTLAAPNLSINGLDVDPEPFLSGSSAAVRDGPEEQHEPFDGRKRARVEDLAREEEDLLREIAGLKRRVPASAAAAFAEQTKAAILADEEALAEAVRASTAKRKEAAAGGDGEGEEGRGKEGQQTGEGGQADGWASLLELQPHERQEGIEGAFSEAVVALGKLMREMPATVAKMERARVAAEYVVTER